MQSCCFDSSVCQTNEISNVFDQIQSNFSLRKQPFLLVPRCWGRFAKRLFSEANQIVSPILVPLQGRSRSYFAGHTRIVVVFPSSKQLTIKGSQEVNLQKQATPSHCKSYSTTFFSTFYISLLIL